MPARSDPLQRHTDSLDLRERRRWRNRQSETGVSPTT